MKLIDIDDERIEWIEVISEEGIDITDLLQVDAIPVSFILDKIKELDDYVYSWEKVGIYHVYTVRNHQVIRDTLTGLLNDWETGTSRWTTE